MMCFTAFSARFGSLLRWKTIIIRSTRPLQNGIQSGNAIGAERQCCMAYSSYPNSSTLSITVTHSSAPMTNTINFPYNLSIWFSFWVIRRPISNKSEVVTEKICFLCSCPCFHMREKFFVMTSRQSVYLFETFSSTILSVTYSLSSLRIPTSVPGAAFVREKGVLKIWQKRNEYVSKQETKWKFYSIGFIYQFTYAGACWIKRG